MQRRTGSVIEGPLGERLELATVEDAKRPSVPIRRACAALTTCALIYAWILFFTWLTGVQGNSWYARVLIVYVLPVLCITLDAMFRGATYGMYKWLLVFRDAEGGELSRMRLFLRAWLGIVLIPLAPLSIALVLFSRTRRSIADHICGTTIEAAGQINTNFRGGT